MDRDQAVLALTAELVESRVRVGELFTTLDISNGLKKRLFPVRHGEVAAAVRQIYEKGCLRNFAYERALIDVNTDSGATITQAYVYFPHCSHPDDYGRRIQDALPPVSADSARDLIACAPNSLSALLAPKVGAVRGSRTRNRVRRDGALPVRPPLVRQAGWNVNDTLTLYVIPAPLAGVPVLVFSPDKPDRTACPAGSVGVPVRVWKDQRVRVCRSALRRAVSGDTLSVPHLIAGSWTVQGDVIQVTP